MAQRAHVPKFGDWENEDNVPYTVYFDKARQGRTDGKMINPNDPQENPDMFTNIASPAEAQAPPPGRRESLAEEPRGGSAIRPMHERRVSKEDDPDPRQYADSPARRMIRNNESTHQRQGIGGRGRPIRQRVGSDHSIERSPLHARTPARGGATTSPSWDGKNSFESSHGTPGRSRLKPTNRGDDTPDRGGAIPRFGEWQDKDPSAAENYTHIFNRARDERHGLPKSPSEETEPPYTNVRKNDADRHGTPCCFSWLRK